MRHLVLILWLTIITNINAAVTPVFGQGGYTIYGVVSAPNGRPASRVTVKINGFSGLDRQTTSDDQGRYEFSGLGRGRYTITVTNPQDATQYSDATEADTSRAGGGNRLIVHISLRAAASKNVTRRPAVLSLAEMAQKIPKDALKAYDKGLKYQEEKKLDQALISFTRSVEIFPEYFQALTARGEVQITQGKIQEAFNDFSEALKYDEYYQPALRGAGFCRLGQQNYLEAARYLVRALEINQSDAKGHLYLGMTLVHLNQPALAEQAFLQALKYDPEATISANLYLAKIYSGNNEYRPAAEALQAYLKARPDAPNAQELKKTEQEYRARADAQSKH